MHPRKTAAWQFRENRLYHCVTPAWYDLPAIFIWKTSMNRVIFSAMLHAGADHWDVLFTSERSHILLELAQKAYASLFPGSTCHCHMDLRWRYVTATHYPNMCHATSHWWPPNPLQRKSMREVGAMEVATAGLQRFLFNVSAASTVFRISEDFEAAGQRKLCNWRQTIVARKWLILSQIHLRLQPASGGISAHPS